MRIPLIAIHLIQRLSHRSTEVQNGNSWDTLNGRCVWLPRWQPDMPRCRRGEYRVPPLRILCRTISCLPEIHLECTPTSCRTKVVCECVVESRVRRYYVLFYPNLVVVMHMVPVRKMCTLRSASVTEGSASIIGATPPPLGLSSKPPASTNSTLYINNAPFVVWRIIAINFLFH